MKYREVKNGECSEIGMHRVHFNQAGVPIFHVFGERDLNPDLKNVSVEVTIV